MLVVRAGQLAGGVHHIVHSSSLVSGERACLKGAVVIKSAVLSVNLDSRKIRMN